jgi:hypothetical protein
LPVPTPTLSFPTPRLPPGTAAPSPSPSPSAAVAGASPGASPGGAAGATPGDQPGAVVASTGPTAIDPPVIGSFGSSLESLVVPGLLLGIPAILILGILAAQLAVGAAWVPVIRRWLHRGV